MSRNSEKPTPPRFRAILVDDESLARVHLASRLMAHPEIEIVGEAADVPSAYNLISLERPDLIFLDIQMPKKSGFALLPEFEKIHPQPAVVFVTAYDEYAIKAFEVNALDFLTKPVHPERLAKTISRLPKRLVSETCLPHPTCESGKRLEAEDLVLLREKSLIMMVKAREIAAIESQGDYTRILLDHGKVFLLKLTLSYWEKRLPKDFFYKISRRLIVNRSCIVRILQKENIRWELHLEKATTPIILSNLESKRLRNYLLSLEQP